MAAACATCTFRVSSFAALSSVRTSFIAWALAAPHCASRDSMASLTCASNFSASRRSSSRDSRSASAVVRASARDAFSSTIRASSCAFCSCSCVIFAFCALDMARCIRSIPPIASSLFRASNLALSSSASRRSTWTARRRARRRMDSPPSSWPRRARPRAESRGCEARRTRSGRRDLRPRLYLSKGRSRRRNRARGWPQPTGFSTVPTAVRRWTRRPWRWSPWEDRRRRRPCPREASCDRCRAESRPIWVRASPQSAALLGKRRGETRRLRARPDERPAPARARRTARFRSNPRAIHERLTLRGGSTGARASPRAPRRVTPRGPTASEASVEIDARRRRCERRGIRPGRAGIARGLVHRRQVRPERRNLAPRRRAHRRPPRSIRLLVLLLVLVVPNRIPP